MRNLSRPRRKLLLLATSLLVSATLLTTVVESAAHAEQVVADPPAGDAFYTPPDPLPQGKPGDIVRWRATGANSWQVMYLSTNALGRPNVVTGTILTPKGVPDLSKVPIVGFAVGTQGPAFRCAASKQLQSGLLYEQSVVNDSLNSGYAVAVTDYEGYSATTTPTYITGRSEGPAVLDSIRAATRLEPAALGETGHQVAVQGYSQGGGASLWAAELQPAYAPELNLVGAVGGGVPADLEATSKLLDGGLGFGFLAFAAVGLDVAYPDLELDSYLNETGRTTLEAARKNDCLVELTTKYPFKRISDFTTSNPLSTPAWQARLAENKLGGTPPKVPVFQYHALLDEIVPFGQADALHKTYCARGVKETWKVYPIADHLIGVFAGSADAKAFLADRFAGRPATSNC